jgi:uncharacterized membrane protein
MRANRPLVVVAIMLLLLIGKYTSLAGNENIRLIQFLNIFAIGMLSGILIRELVTKFRQNK